MTIIEDKFFEQIKIICLILSRHNPLNYYSFVKSKLKPLKIYKKPFYNLSNNDKFKF